MRILKISGVLILLVVAVIATLLVASRINHARRLGREAKEYPPPGNMVEVNGKKLHVYAEGVGSSTLVFMAGHGTSNPTMLLLSPFVRQQTARTVLELTERLS